MATKKLIEVALPLEKINAESAREKTIRHGHPSTLHLWWARRPLATARAVIWASLVDDPSSHPELFPTEEAQNHERTRLFEILEKLVVWENASNEDILKAAKAEILKYTDQIPELLDPFSGGGAIPLEAQRLGLKAHAHDLNPVAVTINKTMIDIPARFSNITPVNPQAHNNFAADGSWDNIQGLIDDIRYYGEWIAQEAKAQVGHLYPSVELNQRGQKKEATVIAWLWARTVKCPNPACGLDVPLKKSFDLSRNKGNLCSLKPVVEDGTVKYKIIRGKSHKEGTINRKGAVCPFCGSVISFPLIREAGASGQIKHELIAIVAEGEGQRVYLEPTVEQVIAARVDAPEYSPNASLPYNPRNFQTPLYGLDTYDKLFTGRQLNTLMAFCNLIPSLQKRVEMDAIRYGFANDHVALSNGGTGATAYSEAICVYIAFLIDKLIDLCNALNRWEPIAQCPRQLFARQAIPMVWDFAEANPFSTSSGSWFVLLRNLMNCMNSGLYNFKRDYVGEASQFDAQSDCGLRKIMISTDPPYYNNIVYADLADFFYVWLRLSLKNIYPDLFRTMLVPKAEELVATPYRFEGSTEKAKEFFEDGMLKAFLQIYKYANTDVPVTIYYAFKQTESDEDDEIDQQEASTGWETMLSAIVKAGFSITGTWPMRTEMSSRAVAQGANALATSIVLVCRKRGEDARVCTRRNFINELKRELRPALQKLQSSNIAPVDLAQSAIGPGMGVYSKYSQVLEADGTPMTVRSALKIINQELDLFFNEQDSDLDSESRFCVDLYSQYAFNEMAFGDANTLATAKNTSVAIMASHGTLFAQKGKVHLIERTELPANINTSESCIWLLCQQLTYRMEKEGVEGCAKAIAEMYGSNAERAKDLAYRLYTIAERKKWAQEGYAYNALVVAWPEIQSRAAELRAVVPQQMTLDDLITE